MQQPSEIAASPQRLESVALSYWSRHNDVQGFDSLEESHESKWIQEVTMLRAPSMPNPKKTIETIDFHGVSIPVEVRVTYRYVAKVAKEYGFGHMSLGSDGEPTEMKLKVGQWADVAFREIGRAHV